jgi:hypothetical protein
MDISNCITFAEASNAFTGQWIYAGAAIVGLFVAVGSYFATRREVDDLKQEVRDMREEIKKDREASILSGDRRSSVLHNRINPLVENTAAIKAGQEAQTEALKDFCGVMKEFAEALKHINGARS